MPVLTATALQLVIAGEAVAQQSALYSYDVHGRVATSTSSLGKTTAYGYDPASNRAHVTTYEQMTTSWNAADLPHGSGFAEADGWASNIHQPAAHMTYGPYTTGVPVGSRTAVWSILVDHNIGSDTHDPVAGLDVWDATAGEQLASVSLRRNRWLSPWTYQIFELPFTLDASRAGHAIEFRTYHVPTIHMRVNRIGYR